MAMQQQPPMRAAPQVKSWDGAPGPSALPATPPPMSAQPSPYTPAPNYQRPGQPPPTMSAQPAPMPQFREGRPMPPGIYPSPGRTMPGQPPGPGGPNGQVAMQPPQQVTGPRPQPGPAPWNPSMGTPPPRWNPMRALPGQQMPDNVYGRPAPVRGQRPPTQLAPGGGYGPSERRPGAPAQWGGGYRPPPRELNWQQMQMQNMPPGMRQAYNNRPMTAQPQGMQPMAPPTQRGRPAASRVNLQGNQLNRFKY